MQTQLRGNRISISIACLLFITIGVIAIHKIDAFGALHILPTLLPFYGLFFLAIGAALWQLIRTRNALMFFATTAPSIVVLSITFFFTGALHYIFALLTGAWYIAIGWHGIRHINKGRFSDTQKSISTRTIFTLPHILFLCGISVCFFLFGFTDLNKGSYVDEKLWTYGVESRIEKYWNNIRERDWINVRPSDKPGVTLAIVSGAGLLWTTPSDFYHNFDNGPQLAQMLYTMRLPILVFCTVMLPFFFFVIYHVFNRFVALLATAMIGLSPILIGTSRIINPDALSWVFMSLTFMLYFLYIRDPRSRWLYMTGIFLGLSLLTKYIANLFIVFFIIEIFTGYLFRKDTGDRHAYLHGKMIDIATILFFAVTTVYLLFPGTWLEPDRLLLATIWSQAFLPVWKIFIVCCVIFLLDHFLWRSKISSWALAAMHRMRTIFYYSVPILFGLMVIAVMYNTYTHMSITDLETLLAAPKSNSQFTIIAIFASGFYTFIYSIAPLALIGSMVAIASLYDRQQDKNDRSYIWHTLLFIMIFYAGSSVSLIASTVRYQIMIYPMIFVIAAYGWHFLSTKLPHTKKIFGLIVLTYIISSIATLWMIMPFYFSYTSTLLPSTYIVNPKDMGDGSYEIAQYLNALPDAQNLTVWSDKNGVCVFFVGYCNSRPHLGEFDEIVDTYDYYVISRGSEYRITRLTQQRLATDPSYPLRLDRLYTHQTVFYEISPGNRKANYIRIIKGDDLTILEKPYADQ